MKDSIEIHYQNSFAIIKMASYLSDYITDNTAFACIGTDRCIVDSLGPLIGTMLTKRNIGYDVYGTLDDPIHAMNIDEKLSLINSKKYDFVIAIDACLSQKRRQGIIEIKEGPIYPGKGIGKVLPQIGDLSVIGIVEKTGKEFHSLMQESSLCLIYDMAEAIVTSIEVAIDVNSQMKRKLVAMSSNEKD